MQISVRDKGDTKINDLVDFLIVSEIPYPKPELASGQLKDDLAAFYDDLAHSLARYCTGLRFWDQLDDRMRRDVDRYFIKEVPMLALAGYEASVRRLASDVREFEIWLNHLSARGIRDAIREEGKTSSDRMDKLLDGQKQASQNFEDLQLFLQRVAPGLQTPHAPSSDLLSRIESTTLLSLTPPDVTRLTADSGASIPPLSRLYVESPFKVVSARGRAGVSKEDWWATIATRRDIDEFFGAYLTSMPGAFSSPLLVLGHPGSGKSSLTRVLASRLPLSRYVPIRVELRRVTPTLGIEAQIEEGMSVLLGRSTTWSEFKKATDLTPVIFLDGLDELIQASDEKQADYLEQVQLFQQRELPTGGAYVIVTSRTVVADQARIPPDSLVLKIEDFGQPEISTFIRTWNEFNQEYFADAGVLPLPEVLPEDVAQLAGQPLLLLLLALLDSENNALQRDMTTRTKASTYRQILTTFVGREVLKHQPGVNDLEADIAVQSELLRLSYIALGMFNRGVQMVSAKEVSDDLSALASDSGVAETVDSAHRLLARFFFVHQAQSKSPEGLQQAYEFLHSTFGEYLVAHLAHEVLTDVYKDMDRISRSRFASAHSADQWASMLFAFQPLSQRTQILEFFAELSAERPAPKEMSDALVMLAFSRLEAGGEDMSLQAAYRPAEATPASRLATYTCNLLLLACALRHEDEDRSAKPHASVPRTQIWDSLAHLWKSQLEPSAWAQLCQVLWARSSAPLYSVSPGDVHVGLEFLTPAHTSEYHLTPISEQPGGMITSLTMVWKDISSDRQSRQLLSADTISRSRNLVSDEVSVYFTAFRDFPVLFDTADLLAHLQNPRLKAVPDELVERALISLLDEPLSSGWVLAHLKTILASQLVHQFARETVERLVEAPSLEELDLDLTAAVIDFLAGGGMGADSVRQLRSYLGRPDPNSFYSENAAFAVRVATALAGGGIHITEYPQLRNWGQLVSRVSLSRLFEDDAEAPIQAVSMARKNRLQNWATSKGVLEASDLPGSVIRRMPIEDALFLIRCGALDPKSGLEKVTRFSRSWVIAHEGTGGRCYMLAESIRATSEHRGITLDAAIDTLSKN